MVKKTIVDFEPLEDRVLIYVEPEEAPTSGVILPKAEPVSKTEAVVVKAGPGTTQYPVTVFPGDCIIFREGAGTPVEIEEINYLLVRQSDCHAIIGRA